MRKKWMFGRKTDDSNPSSYVFYCDLDPEETRTSEGTRLFRVTLKEAEICITRSKLVKIETRGHLSEEVLSRQVISLHRNSHKKKYLKVLSSDSHGELIDCSFGYGAGLPAHVEDPFYELIWEKVFSWFPERPELASYRQFDLIEFLTIPIEYLHCYPDMARFRVILDDLQTSGHPVASLLRESEALDDFLTKLCPTVKTKKDLAYLKENLSDLLPIAVLPLGESLLTLRKKYGETLLVEFPFAFTRRTRNVLRFMLDNLPRKQRVLAVQDIMAVVYRLWQKELSSYNYATQEKRTSSGRYRVGLHDFNEVPKKRWSELADVLHARIHNFLKNEEDYQNVQEIYTLSEVVLFDTVWRWYAVNYFEPRMTTTITLTEMESHFYNLFHSTLRDEFPSAKLSIEWVETSKGIKFCAFPWDVRFRSLDPTRTELLLLLDAMVEDKDRPKVQGINFNAYMEDCGDRVASVEENYGKKVFSMEQILSIINTGTATVDRELVRLGRPISPENRAAYLRADSEERTVKDTWELYDWGVHDNHRIIALKKAGINNEAEVQMYNALPDEMFYELLSTAPRAGDK